MTAAILLTALALVGLNVYAVVLIVLRAVVWPVRLYRPMLVNIALSLAPVVVALALIVGSVALVLGAVRIGAVAVVPQLAALFLVLTGAVWVLLFPNSEYLITELNLNHRERDTPVPLWYDIVQTLTLTLSGIGNGLVGLALVQLFAIVVVDPNADDRAPVGSWVIAISVLTLGGVGVYLGRYLRLNSVDARHPVRLLRRIADHFRSGRRLADLAGFVLTHTVLLGLIYVPLFALVFDEFS